MIHKMRSGAARGQKENSCLSIDNSGIFAGSSTKFNHHDHWRSEGNKK